MVFGESKISKTIDGLDLLRQSEGLEEGVNLMTERILDEKDFKKIKLLQFKQQAAKQRLGVNVNVESESDDQEEWEEEEEGDHVEWDSDE